MIFFLLLITTLGYTTINDNRYIKEKEELINTIKELSNSKYLSIKQMNNIKDISNDIDSYYKKLIFKIKISESLKRLLYYK